MDALTAVPLEVGRLSSIEQRLVDSAREHLGEEPVLAVMRGQTFVSPALLPLLAPLLFIFWVRPRTVILTGTELVTVEESIWFQARVVALVSRYRRGSVAIKPSRLGLQLGDDRKIFAVPGAFPALRAIVALGAREAD